MDNLSKVVIDEKAFEIELRGYLITAYYLKDQTGDALIEIKRGEETIKKFLFPAYKIWNISAHAEDIISGFEEESEHGLYIAGSTGFGGNCYNGGK